MPQTFPCPNQDHGICTIPDPALVVSNQGASLVRPDLAEHLLDVSELTGTLRPLELPHSYDDLVAEVADASGGLATQSALQGQLQAFVGATGRSIIVNCSCGHIFVKDI